VSLTVKLVFMPVCSLLVHSLVVHRQCRCCDVDAVILGSGVTTRGEVRQLPQGAKRQGTLGGAFGRPIVCFALQNSAEFLKRERS